MDPMGSAVFFLPTEQWQKLGTRILKELYKYIARAKKSDARKTSFLELSVFENQENR